MKYPMLKTHVCVEKTKGGKYQIRDCLYDDVYSVSRDAAYLAANLNGKNDPFILLPHRPREYVQEILNELDEEELLKRDGKLRRSSSGISWTLLVPSKKYSNRSLYKVLNIFIKYLWLPVLVIGILALAEMLFYDSSRLGLKGIWTGLVLGLIVHTLFHEAAHAIACISYGGAFFEAGLLLIYFIIPGAYVSISTDNIKGRMKHVHIDLAGIKMNLLLSGLFFLFCALSPVFKMLLLMMGITGVLIAGVNLLLVNGIDGMNALEKMIGVEGLSAPLNNILLNKKSKDKLKRLGITGKGVIAVSVILTAMKISFPLLIILNLTELILCVF
ncbi:MAG: hypothetical protein E7591_05470 [Ruminococcaceae bacterium]|nr:hypothetical protein [Oscillospiraceae bacterium]